MSAECLKIKEDVAYRRIVRCNNIAKLGALGYFLYRVRCKWENVSSNEGRKVEDEGVEFL
jgi:hypothetical protein